MGHPLPLVCGRDPTPTGEHMTCGFREMVLAGSWEHVLWRISKRFGSGDGWRHGIVACPKPVACRGVWGLPGVDAELLLYPCDPGFAVRALAA